LATAARLLERDLQCHPTRASSWQRLARVHSKLVRPLRRARGVCMLSPLSVFWSCRHEPISMRMRRIRSTIVVTAVKPSISLPCIAPLDVDITHVIARSPKFVPSKCCRDSQCTRLSLIIIIQLRRLNKRQAASMYAARIGIDLSAPIASAANVVDESVALNAATLSSTAAETHDDDQVVTDARVPITRMLTLRGLLAYVMQPCLMCFISF
jgi:hypothetical protein